MFVANVLSPKFGEKKKKKKKKKKKPVGRFMYEHDVYKFFGILPNI